MSIFDLFGQDSVNSLEELFNIFRTDILIDWLPDDIQVVIMGVVIFLVALAIKRVVIT